MMNEEKMIISRKVLIIKPEYRFYPIGLAYVMATLEKKGIQFDFIDSAFEGINYEKMLKHHDYLAIATGGLAGDFNFILEITKKIKNINSDMPFILGGNITQSIKPDILFNHLGIDYAVLGEAETALPSLLYRLDQREDIFDDLPGIMLKDKITGSIKRKQPIRLNLDSDDIEPAWHRIEMDHYLESFHHSFPGRNFFPIMTGRGCTGHCSFCSPTLGRFRARKIENILQEMWKVSKDYDFELFGVMTEVLFATEEEINEFCVRYKKGGPNKEWFCSLRLDVDPSVINSMKDAGCIGISIGAESGSDRILKRMRKGITKKQIKTFIEEAKRNQMPLECNVMVGNEEEKQEDIKETFDLLIEEEIFSNINLTITYPGTLIYSNAKERGLISEEYEYIVKQTYIGLADENIAGKNYLNISDFLSTGELHNVIMREVRRYLKFMLGRFNCQLQMNVFRDSYKYSAQCPICKTKSEIGKEFGNWGWDGLVMRLVCPKCYNVSFSRIGSYSSIDKISKELLGAERILVFGSGMNAKSLLAFGLNGLDMEKIIGFVDPFDRSDARGNFFFYNKYKINEINHLNPKFILITDTHFSNASKILKRADISDKVKLIPMMPDILPENLLKNKRVLFVGIDNGLPYIVENLKAIEGCTVYGAVDHKQGTKEVYSEIKMFSANSISSKNWDIAIIWSEVNNIADILWYVVNLPSLYSSQRMILIRSYHPNLNAYLWLPSNLWLLLTTIMSTWMFNKLRALKNKVKKIKGTLLKNIVISNIRQDN